MTLEKGSRLYHNNEKTPVLLLEYVEKYREDNIWLVQDMPEGMTHIMRIGPRDVLTPYREAA